MGYQIPVHSGTPLLEILEIMGCFVTINAMGTQTEIAQKITGKKADYILALKENQTTL